MRPTVFSAVPLRQFLRRNRIATLPAQLMGTEADISVFRKLKELSYRTSYSHRGSFYTLAEIADSDERGLWSSAEFVSLVTARCWPRWKSSSLRPCRIFRFRVGEYPPCAGQGIYAAVGRARPDRSPDGFRLVSLLRPQLSYTPAMAWDFASPSLIILPRLQMEPHRASLVQPDQPELGSRAAGQLRESPEVYPHHHNHNRLES
jgi:hypothetical protein